MKGLAPDERNGVWLVNFQEVPIARTASGFDLIYLDGEHRVLEAIEISQDREFEPFKGHPASALILQPKTITRSKTFTGDRITLDLTGNRPIVLESASSLKRSPEGKVVPISVTSAHLSDVEQYEISKTPTPPGLTPSAPVAAPTAADLSLGARRTIAPIPRGLSTHIPKATAETQVEPKRTLVPTPRALTPSVAASVMAELPSKIEQPLFTHSFPATKVASLEPTTAPVPKQKQREMRRAPRISAPRLVGYYSEGSGPSTPHEIRNISLMGFYMVTDRRWMPGTIIRVTLQALESDGEHSANNITVFSRVVNWGPDGGGFEFVPVLKD